MTADAAETASRKSTLILTHKSRSQARRSQAAATTRSRSEDDLVE
jgi:hypothetical protein